MYWHHVMTKTHIVFHHKSKKSYQKQTYFGISVHINQEKL
jgi:hypothetical protein